MRSALWSILKFCNHWTTQIIVLTTSQPLVDTVMVDVTRNVATWGEEVVNQFFCFFRWMITSCENHTTFVQLYKWSTLVFLSNKSGLSCSKDGQNNPVHKYCPNRLSYPLRKALTIQYALNNWDQHLKHNKQASSLTCSWYNTIIICSNNSCCRSQCFWVYALFFLEIITIMQLKRPFSEHFLVFQRSQILFLLLERHPK